MFNILREMFLEGKMNEKQLEAAVGKGWITGTQKEEILSLRKAE